MENQFGITNIKQYQKETRTIFSRHSIKTDATLAIFDKNRDKKISKPELENVPKEQYQAYIDSLKTDKNIKEDEVFISYEDLEQFLDCDGIIDAWELEGKKTIYGFKGQDIEENKKLKDSTQMSKEEIIAELDTYGIKQDNNLSLVQLRKILNEVRDERSNYDSNSDIVDGHIGTFVQGDNSMCTLLSLLDTMTDEQIKNLYEQKVDDNGKIYYEVTFPRDKESGHTVIITQEELDNKSITVEDNDELREVVGFSTGDADVTLLEMAYTKRFGTDLFDNGGWINVTKNKILSKNPKRPDFKSNKNLENIQDYSKIPQKTTIASLKIDEIADKGLAIRTELPDGRQALFTTGKIIISDGTEINLDHAMSVRRFDAETNELIVSGNSFNSSSELRLPAELLKYFEMSLPKDFE